VYLVLEGVTLKDVRARMNTLPFVLEGLMTLDYQEIYGIWGWLVGPPYVRDAPDSRLPGGLISMSIE
jgi:hypothetical protein